ncbi:hypothetical protein ACIQAL_09340 [Pseudomonas sp. NPDC088368]|uniref:hypothetical protein n=1 Tax=Pseudomonas sp. NPDC088368 TaxID=3364453 RepID=UPI00380B6B2D
MNDEIRAAIAKLKSDAVSVVFTGFVTNAAVESPAMLTGEVWGHVCADGAGTFADGHRIETSDIVQIHSNRESLWVTTRSGSDYGILSFAPLGWIFFANFHKDRRHLDPLPPCSPAFAMVEMVNSPHRLAERPNERPSSVPASSKRKVPKSELKGPEENTRYMDSMEIFVQDTIDAFKKNGVDMPQ